MLIWKLQRLLSKYIPTAMASEVERLEEEVYTLEARVDFLRAALRDIAESSRSDEEDLANWAYDALLRDSTNDR